MDERVEGPVQGYFVAAFAAPTGAGQWLGYFKICRERPGSYWDSRCLHKGCADRADTDAAGALTRAMETATHQIRNLRPFDAGSDPSGTGSAPL